MKVLWITNNAFTVVYNELGKVPPVTTGWVESSGYNLISIYSNIELTVVSKLNIDNIFKLKKGSINHIVFPSSISDESWQSFFKMNSFDIIHIHGTEYPQLFRFLHIVDINKVIFSIQGLVSVYERYYSGAMPTIDIIRSISFRDIFRFDNIYLQKLNMKKRGLFEIKVLKEARHVIGRTTWDMVHATNINNKINYHFCNETLRDSFYENRWLITKKLNFRIFVSQGHYPLKGLHILLKAFCIVIDKFPNTKLYVGGFNFFTNRGYKINGYGNYINNLIIKYNIQDKVIFTGLLNEEQMVEQLVKAHVYVCPSSIENSPNSLGEAQLLGTPTIAAYVGGIPDMISQGENGFLYRFEEFEMLAFYIAKIFQSDDLAVSISQNSIKTAEKRHSKGDNAKRLYSIYNNIMNF